ncbi:restriction endonuclease subunit S [Salinivibrio proteolyticus]|uniref:Restriction endonuclease subunit S n=1 Tax=Salinivibrio proteolyticus TaxID=334715 RepID=A0ABY7LHU7_9GAMM|nr:restriction endonuclease subunit S [Salinivibrio proteolyticus]WBA16759.1 restriction endonuclease subunit S [Salinivibrio proteolyticus]
MEQVLYKLPYGWEWQAIEDVAQIGADRGFVPTPDSEGNVPFIGMTDIDQETGQKSTYELRKFDDVKKGYTKFQRNAVLFAKITPCTENNKTALIDNVNCGFATTEVFPIHALDSVEPKYLLHFFRSPSVRRFLIDQMEGATGRQRVPLKALKNVSVPVCGLREQKRIVEKLDALLTRIDTAIEHLQESITLADALLKSSLSSMLTRQEHWDKVRLNDVCQITSKLCDPREEQYLDMFHIGGANITSFSGELIDLKTARDEKLISGKFPFDNSMVLYSKIRPYLMKVARPTISGICSADIYPLTPDKKRMTRDFLFYLLLSEQFTQYAIEGSSRAGMPKVNRNHLFNFEFHLPSIDEQRSICNSLDSLVKKTNEMSKELASKLSFLTGLRASILDSAFKGEL